MDENNSRSTIRISLSKYKTEKDVKIFINKLAEAVITLKEIY